MIFLSPYVGTGTYRNMFRPVGLGDPDAVTIGFRAEGGPRGAAPRIFRDILDVGAQRTASPESR
jgi:hypothetical protein